MRSPGDILLVSCYELGHQPFHLASLSAMLQQAGYAPAAVDTAVDTLTEEAISRARLVAISVPMHTALRLGQRIAPFLDLVAALEKGKTGIIPGVTTHQFNSDPWIKRTPYIVPTRQQLPSPERYAHLETNGTMRLAGYTETTRGCKHTCLHCPITPVYNGRFFAIPNEVVLADIRAQLEQGVRHITFGDPDFLNGPKHAMRITRALHDEFPGVTFDATIKIEHLLKHQHLLPELKSLGCAFIVSAVESLNDNVLRNLNKGHTAVDVAEAFDLMEQVGIPLRPSLMPFSPWETLESYITLLNFFEDRRLIEQIDPVHFSIRLLIPPGSALLASPDSKLWLRELDAAAFTYKWQHPDPRLDALHQKVASLTEEAELAKFNTIETFFHIKALTLSIIGKDLHIPEAVEHYGTPRVLPHLTESWFC